MVTTADPAVAWAAESVGGARIAGMRGLRAGGSPWLLRIEHGDVTEAILRVGGADSRESFGTEAAALLYAAEHDLPAPRLIAADLDGSVAGTPALLTTVMPGSSRIPIEPSVERLAALGAAAAALHAIPTTPGPGLPLRLRPIESVDFATARRMTGSSPLLEAAERRLAEHPRPASETVFVHGDYWQGNTMWLDETYVGTVDWECAGAGHYGVDLGSLRCDAAIMFGPPAAAAVLDGWQRASGRDAEDVAYWDVVATLSSPAGMTEWLPPIHGQGRADLDARTLTTRRDALLQAALDQLDRE